MGAGMVAVVGAADADRAVDLLHGRGVDAWRAGEVTADAEGTRLVGGYRG
jgi:phosphoribosylformylglycinamidine cyclo-ligase